MADLRPHSDPHPDVAGYLLGALEPDEAQDFVDHLPGCAACRQELEALSGLRELLADVPPAVELPPDLEARTLAAIEAEAAALPASPVGGVVVPLSSARRFRVPRLLAVAAVAIVVLAAGIAVISRTRHTSPSPLAVVRLVAADGGAEHATATIRSTTAGLTITMTAVSLAPSPPGTMYTCWLVAGDDTLSQPDRVSVGSFQVRTPNATVTVQWTTAADLARFPHLGVTTEPSNGNPAHQGPKVLVTA